MKHLAILGLLLLCIGCTRVDPPPAVEVAAVNPDRPAAPADDPAAMKRDAETAEEVEEPIYFWSNPWELQFSCMGFYCDREEGLANRLNPKAAKPGDTPPRPDPDDQVEAARELWRGHSRRYSADVLRFLAGQPVGGEPFRALRREVEDSLRPSAILRELRSKDANWGAWLAYLRPHPDLVPELIAGLKRKTGELEMTQRHYYAIALGSSGDPRAVAPLLALLADPDYYSAGCAAQALTYLGRRETEPQLIQALGREGGWVQYHAAEALGKVGTAAALPALKRVATSHELHFAFDPKQQAEDAIKKIEAREHKK